MIKVAVCDDFLHIRDYFASIVEKGDDMELVGAVSSGAEMEELVRRQKPDVILMDIQMESEYAGIDAMSHILAVYPDIKVIIITIHADADYISRAYSAGAVDYVLKTDSKENICQAIHDAYNGKTQVRPQVANKLVSTFRDMYHERQSLIYTVSMVSNLTQSELEIVKYLCEGKSRAEIAKARCIERDTVKFHIKNILRKLHYSSSAELVKNLRELGVDDLYFK